MTAVLRASRWVLYAIAAAAARDRQAAGGERGMNDDWTPACPRCRAPAPETASPDEHAAWHDSHVCTPTAAQAA